ncbi:C40 family peptidase [Gillisia sp. M10.2A]|uniref:C40 family peptidase n=1 Tax=Gillisia lutea TaxID=2909668 RepID=A0ABS9EDB0_9FLAO|nr:C40 family peptidase [Gillisia lutea]MCF4100864.1 C40 family peptidase [Gillisia lutea]
MSNILKLVALLIFTALLTSCGASRSNSTSKVIIEEQYRPIPKRILENSSPENKINTASKEELPEDNRVYSITSFAKNFEGTRYKYGGTTSNGMDCSGLVYTSFLQENISLPRSSRAMSLEGQRLALGEVNIGDLLFFETSKNKKVINHVGLVVEIQPGHILFIHSTNSKGVIVSSLAENYWYEHFVMARRVI